MGMVHSCDVSLHFWLCYVNSFLQVTRTWMVWGGGLNPAIDPWGISVNVFYHLIFIIGKVAMWLTIFHIPLTFVTYSIWKNAKQHGRLLRKLIFQLFFASVTVFHFFFFGCRLLDERQKEGNTNFSTDLVFWIFLSFFFTAVCLYKQKQ